MGREPYQMGWKEVAVEVYTRRRAREVYEDELGRPVWLCI